MTDFSSLIANPKLMLVGAAAQFGIFGAYMVALAIGFAPDQAGAIAIIGGADGPTAIFLSSKLAPNLMGAIAVSAYSYMALVPVIQPPIMRLLTTKMSASAPAFSKALAVSYSQFVPGNTGISTFGFATLIAGATLLSAL